jgi:hypothetical protein
MTVRTNCKGVVMLRIGNLILDSIPGHESSQEEAVGEAEVESETAVVVAGEVAVGGERGGGAVARQEGHGVSSSSSSSSSSGGGGSMAVADYHSVVDPVAVVRSLFQAVASSGEACSRHLVKVVPLQRTCFAGADEIAACLAPLLKLEFQNPIPNNEPASCTFMVQLKRRNNNAVRECAVTDPRLFEIRA